MVGQHHIHIGAYGAGIGGQTSIQHQMTDKTNDAATITTFAQMVYLFGQHHRPLRQLCRKILQSLRRKGNLVQAGIDKRLLNIRQTRETKIAIEHHTLAILSMQIVRFQIGEIARQGARHHEIAAQTSQFGGKHFQIGEIDVRTFQLRIQPEPLRPPQMPVDGRI